MAGNWIRGIFLACVSLGITSCDEGTSHGGKKSGLTFEQFKTKLEGCMKPFKGKCARCDGNGYFYWRRVESDGITGTRVQKPNKPNEQIPTMGSQQELGKIGEISKSECDECRGKGISEGKNLPSVSEFIARMGEPFKKQEIGHQSYWYWSCADGVVQLPVFIADPSRIAWDDPNLF